LKVGVQYGDLLLQFFDSVVIGLSVNFSPAECGSKNGEDLREYGSMSEVNPLVNKGVLIFIVSEKEFLRIESG